jgi:acyl carrier protein
MVPDSASLILETVAASIEDAAGLGEIPVLAGDNLKDLGLSRLRLLAVFIELEDKFAIEFPSDAIDCFRVVGDVALYIQSHEVTPYDDTADELPAAASHPIDPRPSARDRVHPIGACARVGRPSCRMRRRKGWPMRELARLFWGVVAMVGVRRERHGGHPGSEQQIHFCVILPPASAT